MAMPSLISWVIFVDSLFLEEYHPPSVRLGTLLLFPSGLPPSGKDADDLGMLGEGEKVLRSISTQFMPNV